MNDLTIISYPGPKDDLLLSLTEGRSQYMLPFGGRFRIADFTIRNSLSIEAKSTIFYNNSQDDLEDYVNRYNLEMAPNLPRIQVITNEFSDLKFCRHLIEGCDTEYFLIYNGDNPSIIDFPGIMKKYMGKRSDAVLYRLAVDKKPTMSYKILATRKKFLLKIIDQALKEKKGAPNIFEMLMNIMINVGIPKGTFSAHLWQINNVPEYASMNREVIWNPEVFGLLYREKIIKSQIKTAGSALIGKNAKVLRSFISDCCIINGTVLDSIIYPGVEIGEDTIVRDSIILPNVKIGPHSRIIRTIIDERTDLKPENDYLNIGSNCRVGTEDEFMKNNDYPRSLFESVTLIGKNCRITDGAKIGCACYIASGLGENYFPLRKHLYNGESLIKK